MRTPFSPPNGRADGAIRARRHSGEAEMSRVQSSPGRGARSGAGVRRRPALPAALRRPDRSSGARDARLHFRLSGSGRSAITPTSSTTCSPRRRRAALAAGHSDRARRRPAGSLRPQDALGGGRPCRLLPVDRAFLPPRRGPGDRVPEERRHGRRVSRPRDVRPRRLVGRCLAWTRGSAWRDLGRQFKDCSTAASRTRPRSAWHGKAALRNLCRGVRS